MQERKRHIYTLALAIVINWMLWFLLSIPSYKTLPPGQLRHEILEDLWMTALETALLVELAIFYSSIILRALWRAPHTYWTLVLQCFILLVVNFASAALMAWAWSLLYPEMGIANTRYRIILSDGITVYFVTSIFFMLYLFDRHGEQERKILKTENESLHNRTVALQARLDKLAMQTNNHFVFNSFSTLGGLIENNPDEAAVFLRGLSDIYRYLVRSANSSVVMLADEITFTMEYVRLVGFRYSGIEVDVEAELGSIQGFVPPVSVQQLVENAVKHNRHGKNDTLSIRIFHRDGYIFVANNILPLQDAPASSETGLKNLGDRYSLISDRKVTVSDTSGIFEVGIPILFVEDLTDESCDNRG